MSTESAITDTADAEAADTEAVLRHAFEGTSLALEVARRIDERAVRITEQVRRTQGSSGTRRSRPCSPTTSREEK